MANVCFKRIRELAEKGYTREKILKKLKLSESEYKEIWANYGYGNIKNKVRGLLISNGRTKPKTNKKTTEDTKTTKKNTTPSIEVELSTDKGGQEKEEFVTAIALFHYDGRSQAFVFENDGTYVFAKRNGKIVKPAAKYNGKKLLPVSQGDIVQINKNQYRLTSDTGKEAKLQYLRTVS